MESIDPTTGQPIPADAIQRVLFVAPSVHVYNIPPMSSAKGHSASAWTPSGGNGLQIFTARGRIVETAFDAGDDGPEKLRVDFVLEDPSTGALFAAAPYTSASAVEPAIDSSRFFAITVRDPSGRKAVLGIGFEERSDAFDFGVTLQEARKALGWDGAGSAAAGAEEKRRDYSLKEGETITVNLGGTKFGRKAKDKADEVPAPAGLGLSGFSLPPPPSAPNPVIPPPPPPAGGGREKKPLSESAHQLGFDDGKFGEFA